MPSPVSGLIFSSDYARDRYSHELKLAGKRHGQYPDWIVRVREFDPVRVHLGHYCAIWQKDVTAAIL